MLQLSSPRSLLTASLLVLTVVAASCGGSADATDGADEALPGTGITVSMARANWETGYFQAEIVRQLVEELGYAVNDPASFELDPGVFYPRLALGEIDFWVNGWFPSHDPLLDEELDDGSAVRDHVLAIGTEVAGGGLQGVLVDTATAEAASITWFGDIGDSPATAALFDVDGNGRADLVGCDAGWGCQTLLDDLIEQNGWTDTIEQMSGTYDELWADAVARFEAGDPVLAYTWTPSGYLGEITPGAGARWLSLASAEGDDNGGAGLVLPASECPGQPCNLGFAVADIRVVANREFLAANPVLARLFEVVGFQLSDIVIQNYQMRQGEGTPADVQRHAAEWIQSERRTIDLWLREASSASG